MNLVAVFVENKPGQTANVAKILSDAGVNVCWVTIASSGSFGVMKFLVDKLELAVKSLKAKGFMVSQLGVLAVEVLNRPGSLQTVADLLSRNGLNLDNCSGFVSNGHAVLVIEVPDLSRAQAVLLENGLRLLSQEELLQR